MKDSETLKRMSHLTLNITIKPKEERLLWAIPDFTAQNEQYTVIFAFMIRMILEVVYELNVNVMSMVIDWTSCSFDGADKLSRHLHFSLHFNPFTTEARFYVLNAMAFST